MNEKLEKVLKDVDDIVANGMKYDYFLTTAILGILSYFLKDWEFDPQNGLVDSITLLAIVLIAYSAYLSIRQLALVVTLVSVQKVSRHKDLSAEDEKIVEKEMVKEADKSQKIQKNRNRSLVAGLCLVVLSKSIPFWIYIFDIGQKLHTCMQ